MRLAGFEWRKILSGKIGWILVGFFCLNLGAYYIYMMPYIPSQEEKEVRQQWEKRLAEQDGEIEEKLVFLQAEQEKCSQENLAEKVVLYDICQEYTAVTEYHAFLDGLKERADTMKTFSIFNKNGSFSQKNIQKTSEDFKRVESIEIQPMNDIGMKTLHQFYLTDVLMLLLVCLFSFQVYGRDYRSGMGNLIRVTPRGRGFLRLAQTEAVALSILMMGLLLYGSNIVMTEEILDLGNLSYNIQGMEMFRNVSFPCTMGQYLVFFMLGKLLALLFSCLVFQVFAVWFQGQNLAWICSAAVIVVSFVLWFFLPNSPQAKLFRYLNPIGLLDIGQVVGNYQNLNIFQTPVSLFTAAILFVLILGLLLFGAILLLRGQERAAIHMEIPVRETKKFTKTVFSYEFYKIMINQRSWGIVAALGLVSILTIKPWQPHIGREDFCYEAYLEDYKGAYTEEKRETIEEAWEKQEFLEQEAEKAYETLCQQVRYLETSKAGHRGIVSLRIYKDFFFYEQLEVKNTLYVVIATLLCLNGLFYHDRKKQMQSLLCAVPRHRSVYFAKMKLAAFTGGVSSLLVWGITCVKFFMKQEVEGMQFSIHSIPEFAEMPYHGSILSYMVISLFLRVLIGMYLGILFGFLSQILALPTQNIICAILLFVLPLCMLYIGRMGYENPLIQFINRYLSPLFEPLRLVYAFPAVWFQMRGWQGALFVGMPIVCLLMGKKIWGK